MTYDYFMASRQRQHTEEALDWQWLVNSGRIRHSLLNITPDDIAAMNDLGLLTTLLARYGSQASHQNWYEAAYIQLMREAVTAQLFNSSSVRRKK